MKNRFFPLFIIVLILFFSCASKATVEKNEQKSERRKEAILKLGEEMIQQSGSLIIQNDSLSPALDKNFSLYEKYIPYYFDLKNSNLEKISHIIPSFMGDIYTLLWNDIEVLSQNAELYIQGENSLTSKLRSDLFDHLVLHLGDLFYDNPELLREAFKSVKSEFDGIREVYRNLHQVGLEINLPEIKEADYDVISELVITNLFEVLSFNEAKIKNSTRNRNSDSVYSVFWEE